MPYAITDNNPECSGWAVVDPENKVFGCHKTKESAIKQAVALSIATDEPFIGERNAAGDPIIICDIDGTLLNGDVLIQKTYAYVQDLDGALFIVTGRPESERDKTVTDLEEAGVSFSRLIMNTGSAADSNEFKKAAAEELLKTYDVIAAVENNSDARNGYSELGIKTVNPSEIEDEARAINQDAPAYMREAARRGLEYYAKGLGGDGLVDRTIREARLMADGKVSDEKWVRVAAWIARHLGDLDSPDAQPGADNYPSPGVVAHLLWGSGPSKRSAQRALDYAEAVVIRIRAEEESQRMANQKRATPDELSAGDFVAWLVGTESYAGQVVSIDGETAIVRVWDEEDDLYEQGDLDVVVPIAALNVIESLQAAEEMPTLTGDMIVPSRDKWVRAAWKIKAKLEGIEERTLGKSEIRTNHVELRAEGNGMSFTGYASVFGVPSLPLPFTEIVKPGAFKRSLQSRNRMMLLWNHDTSNPLASTRNGSLQLTEDNFGLKVTAMLPDTTLGRDIAELVRTGVIDAMSFGFSVKKDSWSQDGNTRYLEDVSLYEVSLVSTPAYEQTSGTVSVRSTETISADVLAEALFKIESGEELDPEQGALITEVVAKLTKTPEVEEVQGDILALKKKKLDLLMIGI